MEELDYKTIEVAAKNIDDYLAERYPNSYHPSFEDYTEARNKAGIPMDLLEKVLLGLLKNKTKNCIIGADITKEINRGLESGLDFMPDGFISDRNLDPTRKYILSGEYTKEWNKLYISYDGKRGFSGGKRFDKEVPVFTHDKERGIQLVFLAYSMDNSGKVIDPKRAIEFVKDRLNGKRILSLGDDTGSFSEILSNFGCHPVGIEYSREKVAMARTGIFSEDRKPNNYVVFGDIWDLLSLNSSLLKKVTRDGKFDAIFSNYLFTQGSGGEEPGKHKRRNKIFRDLNEVSKRYREQGLGPGGVMCSMNFAFYMANSCHLLNSKGVQVHIDASYLTSRKDCEPDRPCKLLMDRIFKGELKCYPGPSYSWRE